MKVTITETGVYDPKGERIPVGTEISVKGDAIPDWLVGKCQAVAVKKTAVTNPAIGAVQQPVEGA